MKSNKLTLLAAGFLMSTVTLAQPGNPPGGGQPTCWPPPCIPVDSGVAVLIAAGVAFGAFKLLQAKRKSKQVA